MVKSDRRCLPQERRRDVVGIRRRRRSLGQLVSLFATLCTADATACVTAPAEARIRLFGSALAATILLSAGVSRASGEGASADQVAANAQEGRRESSTRTQALPETLEFSTSPSSVTHGVRRAPMRGEGPQSSSGGFCTDAGGRTRCDPEELESDGVPRKDDGDGGVVGPDGNLDGNQPGEERKRLQEISEDLEGFSSIEACPARDEPPRKGDGLSECAGIRAEEEEPGVGARFIVRWHDFFTIGQHGELLCRALGCPAGDGEDPASGTRSEEATRRCEVGDVRAHSRGLCSGCVPSPFESRDEDTVAGEGVLGSRGSAVPDAPGGNHTPASSQGVSISPHRVSPCGDGGALPQDGYSWALLRRENPATLSYPSDFSTVVVRPDDGGCGGGYQEENGCKSDGPSGERGFDGRAGCGTGILGTRFLEALERSPLVKSVHSDKIYHRGPSSEEGRLRGGHEDGVGVPLNGWQEIGVGDWPEREELVYLPMERLHLGSPGRRGDSIDLGADDGLDGGENRQRRDSATGRRLKSKAGAGGNSGTRLRGVHKPFVNAGRRGLWLHEQGFLGAGVRVAVFDTGLDPGDHDFDNVVERINWTNERTLVDHEGHGTHVAGVIGGRDPTCPGFAPDAELYIFRVFASRQVSYTSWFLDAFNYALFLGIDVINLSSGGPDFRDQPFVDKVRELSANGILLVSAVGNDGPLFGTQHNPADQADTIGVGALAADESRVASFQSRGMTTWELPAGYGRVKPDVLAVGEKVLGPKAGGKKGECSGRTGTSVASPVVAGAVALLASTVPMERRSDIVNPASMKQVLVESARRLPGAGMFEQGAGALHIEEAYHALRRYTPRASLIPPKLDFEEPYMWPFAYQPLYHGARPTMFNFTVVNGMGVTGCIRNVTWAEDGLDWSAASEGGPPGTLELKAEYPEVLWPWSGYLAVSLSVTRVAPDYPKVVTGTLKVVVESEAGTGEGKPRVTVIDVPVAVKVVRTPPRERRLLWDQFHSLAYPSAFVPRDFLDSEGDMLDRKGDHPHTNFRSLWESLVGAGYFVEVLGADWTCFDAENYGALLMVDLEDELGEGEKIKLEEDVYEKGLSLVVFADWYSEDVMSRIRFFDDNTRVRWEPITGGSNVPALNEFLMRFGMALGGQVFDGVIPVNPGREISFASGNALARAPPGSLVLRTDAITRAFPAALEERPGDRLEVSLPNERASLTPSQSRVVALGALDTARLPRGARGSFEDTPSGGAGKPPTSQAHGGGRLFLMGDSSCADDAYLKPLDKSRSGRRSDCLWLFRAAVQYACEGVKDAALFGMAEEAGAGYSDGLPLPSRTASNELFKYSRVIGDDSKDLPSAAGDRCEARDWKKVKRAPSEKAAS